MTLFIKLKNKYGFLRPFDVLPEEIPMSIAFISCVVWWIGFFWLWFPIQLIGDLQEWYCNRP